MKKKITAVILAASCAVFGGCSSDDKVSSKPTDMTEAYTGINVKSMWESVNGKKIDEEYTNGNNDEDGQLAVKFEHFPDSYKPQKSEYNFYFT